MEKAKLYKQGGSIVVSIPKNYLKSLGWQRGDEVMVILEGPDKISYIKVQEGCNIFSPGQLITSAKKERSNEADRIHTTG